jgi:hypothetical protein
MPLQSCKVLSGCSLTLRELIDKSPPFFLIGIVGGGVQLGPFGTAATNGLLCQPRVIMMMEKLVK